MSLKRCNDEVQAPVDATSAQPAKSTKKGTTIVLHDDIMRQIVPYADSETLTALACAGKTTRDAAIFRDVTDGRFSLAATSERYFVELAKKDGFNAYFQDLFSGHGATHLKWEALFAKLGDIGTMEGLVPMGVTAGALGLLKYGSRLQLEALAKLCDRNEMDDPALLLKTRKRLQKLLEKGPATGERDSV